LAAGLAGIGAAVGAAGGSLVLAAGVLAAGAAGFAGLADRFFFLTAGALPAAVLFATDRVFLRVAAFFFFFATVLVFLTEAVFLVAVFRARFVLRAPTFFLAALPRFDFDFFAMDHSAVSGGFRQEWPRRTRPRGFRGESYQPAAASARRAKVLKINGFRSRL
jgi:hypothetical protein